MELIRISDSKLKVMLNADDMQHYALDRDAMNYDNTGTRRALWQILDDARQETGFDAAASRVLIQVYPSRDGGCELYVTKLLRQLPAGTEEPPAEKKDAPCLYEFETADDLLAACRALAAGGYAGESAAYAEGKRLFLEAEEADDRPLILPGFRPGLLPEFGRPLDKRESAYIREHAECLIPENAVARLAPLA